MHNLVFEAAIGDRKINASFEGVNLERQRNALKRLVDTFFEDLDEEIGLEKEFAKEAEAAIEEIKEEEEEPAAILPKIEEIKTAAPVIEPVYEDKTVNGFKMEDIIKNYEAAKTFGTVGGVSATADDNIDVVTYENQPEEVQQAIKNGINDRNFKISVNGQPQFQAYYVCTGCKNRGKHFIPLGRKSLTCHDCKKRMVTRKAIDKEFPHNDSFGNMFIAGDFVRREEYFDSSAKQELKKQQNVYLA